VIRKPKTATATSAAGNPTQPSDNPNTLTARPLDGETQGETIARHALQPEIQAALTIKHFERGALVGASLNSLVDQLSEQSVFSNNGDLSRSEALLTAQAHTLDAIFHDLARRAAVNAGEYLNACEIYLRLALKAQSQCRATIETLAEIKNPSHVTFAKQANIAHGPQQVNNGVPSRGENNILPSKLLEQTSGEWLDTGATRQAISGDQAMATVGAVNRTSDKCG